MRYPRVVLPPDPETQLVVLPPLSKAGLWDDIEAAAEQLNADRLNGSAAAAIAKAAYDDMAALAERNRRYWAERAEVEAEVLAGCHDIEAVPCTVGERERVEVLAERPPHTASDF